MFIGKWLKREVRSICIGAWLVSFIFLGPVSVWAQEDLLSPSADKWITPNGLSDVQYEDVPELITPDLNPPFVLGTRAWRDAKEVQIENLEPDFSDEVVHWTKIENLKDSDCLYEAVLDQGKKGEVVSRIRFSLLPSLDIKAADDVIISKPKLTAPEKITKDQQLVLKKEKEKILTNEACEALSKVKKRQLAAIESDRKTLNALKNALKDLGLTKKLSFITKDETNVSASTNVPVDSFPKQ